MTGRGCSNDLRWSIKTAEQPPRRSSPSLSSLADPTHGIALIYNFDLPPALFRMGVSLCEAMTLPLILSLPDMNMLCALALPSISFWKSWSESWSVPVVVGQLSIS